MHCLLCEEHLMDDAAISLLGYGICPRCESLIISLDVSEPAYDQIIGVFRSVWQEILPALEHE